MWSITMQVEQDIYEAKHEKIIGLKNTLSSNQEDWVSVTESDLKVGDIVYVEYCPDSVYCNNHSLQNIVMDPFSKRPLTDLQTWAAVICFTAD